MILIPRCFSSWQLDISNEKLLMWQKKVHTIRNLEARLKDKLVYKRETKNDPVLAVCMASLTDPFELKTVARGRGRHP